MVRLIILWIFLGLIALLLLALLIPVGVRIRYGSEELKLWYAIGPIRILHKANDGKKKPKKKDKDFDFRKFFGRPIRETDSPFERFRSDLKLILSIFGYLRPRIRIKYFALNVKLAGDSPDRLAMSYGGAWAAIGGILPILEEAFTLQKRDLNVACDFDGEATSVEAKLDLVIGLGRLLFCLIRCALAASDKAETNTNTERR